MKKLLALCGLILLSFGSRAQITYHDIVPDSTIGGGPTLTFWVLQPPTSSAQLHIFWSMNNTVFLRIHGSFGFGEILMNGGFPAKLPVGADISTAAVTWAETTGANGSLNENGNGNWRGAGRKGDVRHENLLGYSVPMLKNEIHSGLTLSFRHWEADHSGATVLDFRQLRFVTHERR